MAIDSACSNWSDLKRRSNKDFFLKSYHIVLSMSLSSGFYHDHLPCFIVTQKLPLKLFWWKEIEWFQQCMSWHVKILCVKYVPQMSRNIYNYTVDRQSKNIDILLNLFYFIACDRNSDVMYQIHVDFSSRKAALYFEIQKPVVFALFSGTE